MSSKKHEFSKTGVQQNLKLRRPLLTPTQDVFIYQSPILQHGKPFSKSGSAQRTSIADGGGIEKPPPWQPKFIIYSKIKNFILMLKRVPSARTKADSDMLPIAPTSSPTIGNTLVGRSLFFPSVSVHRV